MIAEQKQNELDKLRSIEKELMEELFLFCDQHQEMINSLILCSLLAKIRRNRIEQSITERE